MSVDGTGTAAGSSLALAIGERSVRQVIRDLIIDKLNVIVKPAGVPSATKRRWMPGADVPAMAVIFLDEPVAPKPSPGFPLARRSLALGIECVAGADLPELSDDEVEPMLAWATAALGETNLAGLALSIEEQSTVWDAAQADRFYLRATLRLNIEYQTKRNDLTKKQ